MKTLLTLLLLTAPMPMMWTNCDVGHDHREVVEAVRKMTLPRYERERERRDEHERWAPTRRPVAFLLGGGQLVFPGTTQTILTEQLRGATAGSVALPAGITSGVEFFLISSAWPTTPGNTLTVLVERSYDGGLTWNGYAASTFTSGSAPIGGKSRPDGMPFLRFTFDGLAAVWRWTITPNAPFVWGAGLTF